MKYFSETAMKWKKNIIWKYGLCVQTQPGDVVVSHLRVHAQETWLWVTYVYTHRIRGYESPTCTCTGDVAVSHLRQNRREAPQILISAWTIVDKCQVLMAFHDGSEISRDLEISDFYGLLWRYQTYKQPCLLSLLGKPLFVFRYRFHISNMAATG